MLAVYKVAMGQDAAGTEQDYIKALNTELLAGTGPDVLVLDGLPIASYIQKGVLAELGEDNGRRRAGAARTFARHRKRRTANSMPYRTGVRIPLAYADGDASGVFSSLANPSRMPAKLPARYRC